MTEGTASRTRALTAVVAVAATVLVLLVAIWAASTGHDDPFPGEGLQPDRASVRTPSEVPTEEPTGVPPGGETREGDPSSWATVVVGLLVLGVGVALLFLLTWLVGGYLVAVRTRRRDRWRPEQPDLPPLDPVVAIRAAIADDAADQLALLQGGTPRNAIVECWHRFEVQAERAGVPRESWETSAEFTLRLLDLVEADAAAVERLSVLYREARFSEHDLGEDARAAGAEALQAIHRDLRTLLSGGQR